MPMQQGESLRRTEAPAIQYEHTIVNEGMLMTGLLGIEIRFMRNSFAVVRSLEYLMLPSANYSQRGAVSQRFSQKFFRRFSQKRAY